MLYFIEVQLMQIFHHLLMLQNFVKAKHHAMVFALTWLFLFETLCHGNFNLSVLGELEILADAYYNSQKDERISSISTEFVKLNPNFPCLFGTIPIGGSDPTGIKDGHKFGCGIHAISGRPIVYSFGSFGDQRFELAFLRLRPDALIYLFELDASRLPENRDPRIQYFSTGLGGYPDDVEISKDRSSRKLIRTIDSVAEDNSKFRESDSNEPHFKPTPVVFKFKTMFDIMIELNHTYVDVLKMDIEGYEFKWLKFEANLIAKRIGQFLVELHVASPENDAIQFTQQLEDFGMRVFHKELNHLWEYGSEFSFIQRQWTVWETQKSLFLPLTKVPEGIIFDQIVRFEHESSGLDNRPPHKYFLSCNKIMHHLPDKHTLEYVSDRLQSLNVNVTVNAITVPLKTSLEEVAESNGHTLGLSFLSTTKILNQPKGKVMIQPKYAKEVYIMTPSGERAKIPSAEVFYQLGGTITVILQEAPLCELALIPLCRSAFNDCMA